MSGDRCALVVDGGAALRDDPERGLAVVAQQVLVGDHTFVDDGDFDSYPEFYRRLRSAPSTTTATSTPSPGAYLDAFRRSPADRVLCLTIPARWSGMHDAASLAAGMLEEEEGRRRVTVIDTGTAAGGFALVARVGASHCAAGSDAATTEAAIRNACNSVAVFGSLATLTYVARSGRVPALIAGISNTLHVRPVFRLNPGGETGRIALTRTAGGAIQALERVAGDLGPGPHWLLVFHADAPDEAATLAARISAATKTARCDCLPLSPMSGAHTGPGTIGFAALPWPGGPPPD